MNYRSRTEIVAMILNAANGGATKTKIMYNVFLSYNQLREYLTMLIENDLIEYLGENKIFRTTENGLNLLKIHNEMTELLHTTIENDDDELI
jgi:predicted transcriptional regulator